MSTATVTERSATGKAGRAVSFDGRNDLAVLGTAPALHLTGHSFTVEAWVRFESSRAAFLPVLGTDETSPGAGLHLCVRQGTAFFGFFGDDTPGRTQLTPGAWTHLAWRFDAETGEQAIFVNGVLDISTAGHQPFQGEGLVRIGRYGGDNYFQGQISEVRIWSRAIDDTEIRSRMQQRAKGDEPDLVGCWPLDDATDGKAMNVVAAVNAECRGSTWAPADAGNHVLQLDGRTGGFRAPCLLSPAGWTVQMYFCPEAARGGLLEIADVGSVYLERGKLCAKWGDDEITHALPAASEGRSAGRSAPRRWIHLTWSVGDGMQTLFVDGEPVEEGELSAEANETSVAEYQVLVGWVQHAPPMKGRISDVRIWRGGLDAASIAEGARRRPVGNESDLLYWWPLNSLKGKQIPTLGSRAEAAANPLGDPKWVDDNTLPLATPGVIARGRIATLTRDDAHIAVAHRPEFDFRRDDDFTVEAWIQASAPDSGHVASVGLFGKRPESGRFPFSIEMESATGRVQCFRGDGAEPVLQSKRSLYAGGPHHVAFVKQNGTLALYFDGQLEQTSSDAVAGRVNTTAEIRAGALVGGASVAGQFSELRIWDHGRDRDQIEQKHSRRLEGNEPGLIGYWPLDDGKGDIGRDGRTRPGAQFKGRPETTTAGPPIPQVQRPVVAFDGDGDHVSISEAEGLNFPDGLTVEAWVRPAAPGGRLYMCPVVSSHGTASGFELRSSLSGAEMMVTLDRRHVHVSAGLASASDQWLHLAGVYDGESVRLYLNGVLAASEEVTGTYTPYPGELRFGHNSWWLDRAFAGELAEVRLWRRARSGEEILADLFHQPADLHGLTGLWPLAEGDGQQATDHSGAGFHGTLDGAEWALADLPPRLRGDAPLVERKPTTAREKELHKQTTKLGTRVQQKESEIDSLKAQQSQAAATIRKLRKENYDLKEERRRWQEEKARLEEESEQLRDVEKQLEQQREKDGAVSLALFIKNTKSQIETARKTLGEGSYRLGQVSLELQMLPAPDGGSAIFPQKDDLKDVQGALSKMTLNFDEERPPEAASKQEIRVPDLEEQTETLARRNLAAAGLLVETQFQAITGQEAGIDMQGRVVSQLPTAGEIVEPNSTVLIFIGKKA